MVHLYFGNKHAINSSNLSIINVIIKIGDNMQDLYMEQVKNFINDFYNIYNSDKYISKKELDDYYDKYIDIIELSKKY